jgi:predicted ferric reductase
VLIPFASSWRPVPIALGVLAMYLIGLLALSTRLRPFIGQKAWRTIHYGSFLAWAMALVHAVDSGSDATVAWVQVLYLASATAVFLMLAYRILLPTPPKLSPTSST